MTIYRSVADLSASPGGRIYRPRMAARLSVPIAGTPAQRLQQEKTDDVITFTVQPKAVRIQRNDHNHADTCSLALDWTTAGVDARMLDDATAEVHIADADDQGNWTPSSKTVRFAGIVKEVDSSRPEDEAAEVRLELMDYTALFLAAKPFGSRGVPKLSQTLREAWLTIVGTSVIDGKVKEHTPGTAIFRDPASLIFRGVDPDVVIGEGVPARFRKVDYVQTKPETDAWAVWMQCVGMLGLLSWIEKDKCIVSTSTNYYTEGDAPKMIWGRNISSWHENRVSALARKGIILSSYDTLSRQTVEAYWPPIGDPTVARKRASAQKIMSVEKILAREDRDIFAFPGVASVEKLTEIAKRVHDERSRQELEGAITTAEMVTETEHGELCDLLDLAAGETISVEVEPGHKQLLASLDSDAARIEYLTERGYEDGAAQIIVANMKNFADLEARFLTKSVGITCEVDDTDGEFAIEITYVNRIQLTGGTE